MATPSVLVFATGGTIGMHETDTGLAPDPDFPEVLEGLVAGICGPLGVEARINHLLPAIDSANADADTAPRIARAISARVRTHRPRGVVILHGTDAMEETALLVGIQHRAAKPVIFTGAQFAADSAAPDGPRNLADALAAALGAPGVSLVFGGRQLPAWGLYKAASDRADAFALAGDGHPALPDLPGSVAGIRVDLVAIHPGVDALHLDASITAGARGIVLAALGSGNASPEIVAATARAHAAGIPVVVSSRVPQGVLEPAYGGGGGGHDLGLAGAIHSRLLRPGQARILLAALIASNASTSQIAAAFA